MFKNQIFLAALRITVRSMKRWQIPCKMTGFNSKLLQIQGKWYQERNQKKKPDQEKIVNLFFTPLVVSE
jgi:hypothetical protein